MTDTTTRLLRLWERFPVTQVESLMWQTFLPHEPQIDRWEYCGEEMRTIDAHAIAGWRLLTLAGCYHGQLLAEALELSSDPFPITLDWLISFYWQAKGEQEPSE